MTPPSAAGGSSNVSVFAVATTSRGSLSAASLILASRSPQRRAILEQIGVRFEVRVTDVAELEAGPPDEVALENAYRKAAAVAPDAHHTPVLAVDTVVTAGGRIYGKPLDPTWKVCPFCEAEIGVPAPAPRRSRRRRETPAEQPAAEQTSTT